MKRGRRASNLTEQIKLILRIIIIRNCWLGSSCNTIESDKLLVADVGVGVGGGKRVCVSVLQVVTVVSWRRQEADEAVNDYYFVVLKCR